jgi:hypothetical protein
MNTILIVFLFIIGGTSLVLSVIQIVQKYKKANNHTSDSIRLSQIELYRKFAEECLFDCGFDLDNVYIAPNTSGGMIFQYGLPRDYKSLERTFTAKDLKSERYSTYSNTFEYDKLYMLLPEINDLHGLSTWLHEIGHYMCGHMGKDPRPKFIKEYEAEMYSKTLLKLCPIEPGPSYYPQYTINVHNIYLQSSINSGKNYIKSFLSDADERVKREYLSATVLDYIENEVEIPMI